MNEVRVILLRSIPMGTRCTLSHPGFYMPLRTATVGYRQSLVLWTRSGQPCREASRLDYRSLLLRVLTSKILSQVAARRCTELGGHCMMLGRGFGTYSIFYKMYDGWARCALHPVSKNCTCSEVKGNNRKWKLHFLLDYSLLRQFY